MEKQYHKKTFFIELYYSLFLIATIIFYPVLIIYAICLRLLKYVQNKRRDKSIKGEVAVITGSGRGLGRILAIELAKRGCHVAVVDVQQHLAEETAFHIAKNYPVKTKSYKVDVTDYQQLVELNKNVTQDLGDITILINNAGILTNSSIEEPKPEEIQNMINVNFVSIPFTKQIFLPKMKALNKGHIVNISSLSALMPSYPYDVYGATKAAVRSLTSSLRSEIMAESKNITATTVMPLFLTTNEVVERIVTISNITKLVHLIDGSLAAQYIVEGMLNNEDEMTIPKVFLYNYKLLELLPVKIREVLLLRFLPKDLPVVYKEQMAAAKH